MWMKGVRDITNSNRTIKEAHSDYIRFSFKDTTMADEGTYFIVARNKLGVDRAFCNVSVIIQLF
jgi:Immunoglobulin I-set domain